MGEITIQLVTLAGLSVNVPDMPVTFLGLLGTFDVWVVESGNFITDKSKRNRQADKNQQACYSNRQAVRYNG